MKHGRVGNMEGHETWKSMKHERVWNIGGSETGEGMKQGIV